MHEILSFDIKIYTSITPKNQPTQLKTNNITFIGSKNELKKFLIGLSNTINAYQDHCWITLEGFTVHDNYELKTPFTTTHFNSNLN